MRPKIRIPTLCLAAVLLPAFALADDDDGPFSLDVAVGAEYDSNVAVLELDTSSGEGDVAALIDLGLGFVTEPTDALTFRLGYDFSQSLHDEFDAFDIRIHRGSAGLDADLGGVEAGLAFQYADAALDDEGFLVLRQVTPSLSRLFGERVFVRLAWDVTDKEFATAPGRDAEADSPSLDLFVFGDGARRHVLLGYRHHDEDAVDDTFDYRGGTARVRFSRRASHGSRDLKFSAEARYEFRDYAASSLILTEPREDDRYRLRLELEVPLARRGYVTTRYEYADNRSNLGAVDFDEHVASVRFGVRM